MKNYFKTNLKSFSPIFWVLFISCNSINEKSNSLSQQPNILIIYVDDMGYGDLSCYGATTIETPHIDQLAAEGKKLTSFYVASPVCSPSRAALLTGCYPLRVGIPHVLAPHGISWAGEKWRIGLNQEESTLPELLKEEGYVTGIFGKWHLGHMPEHLPYNHGFDSFYGIPYSNDMRPETDEAYPPLPLIRDSIIVEENPDQTQFTSRFTKEAIQFIEEQGENPFFVYLAHPMPHVPIYASKAFKGKSARGLYGDVIEELDASVGEIMQFLNDKDLKENTIVILTSDNGPSLHYGNHAGSAGRLREGKRTTMEGGQRVPCIISWPRGISVGESDQLITNMDLMPTLNKWANAGISNLPIDGIEMTSFLKGEALTTPRKEFLFYRGENLEAMRSGKWKIHLPHRYQTIDFAGHDGVKGKYKWEAIDWVLYDLSIDPGETNNISMDHPQIMDSLKSIMIRKDSLLRSGLRKPAKYQGEVPKVGQLWH